MVLGKRKVDGGQSVVGSPPAAKKQHRPGPSFSKVSRAPAVLGRAERAALRKERRASKPHHDIIENANQLYRFDFKRMDGAERRTKIAELMERTAGKVADVLTKHDTSRVFQLMVKYGSAEQRQRMQAECKGSILGLCLNHYAHHFVLKLLQYGSPVVRAAVWRELQGNVTQLAFHADGAVVFDYLYASEKSKKHQRDMLRGLLHPSFALDAQTFALTNNDSSATSPSAASDSGTLSELCGSHASIAASMVQHVGGLLEKWLNKDQLQYRFVHSLLRQYLELPAALLPRSSRAELISSVCSSPSLSALSGGNDGVLVLCMAVSDGVAKDRKQVMRCLKTDALSVCRSMYGHLLLMRVADCVDDTVAVDKNVWSGLLSSPYAVSQLIDDVHGAKVVRFMLKGKASSQFLSPFEATFQRQSQLNSATVSNSNNTIMVRCAHIRLHQCALLLCGRHHKGTERSVDPQPLNEPFLVPLTAHLLLLHSTHCIVCSIVMSLRSTAPSQASQRAAPAVVRVAAVAARRTVRCVTKSIWPTACCRSCPSSSWTSMFATTRPLCPRRRLRPKRPLLTTRTTRQSSNHRQRSRSTRYCAPRPPRPYCSNCFTLHKRAVARQTTASKPPLSLLCGRSCNSHSMPHSTSWHSWCSSRAHSKKRRRVENTRSRRRTTRSE